MINIPKEKYEKIIEKHKKYKSNIIHLKKLVEKNQQQVEELTQRVSDQEKQLAIKTEENDVLSFNNRRLEKRLTQVMLELQDKQTKRNSFFSFLGGDSQNAAQLKQELEVARSELESKISENESVHIQLFELKQSTAEQIRVLREKINELENKLKKKEAEYVALSNAKDDYQKNAEAERNKLSEEIKSLKHNLAIMKENERNLTEHSTQIQNELKNLTQFVDRKIPFDDTHVEEFNFLNVRPFNRNLLKKRIEVEEQAITTFKQLSKCVNMLLVSITARIQLQNASASLSHLPIIKYLGEETGNMVQKYEEHTKALVSQCEAILEFHKNKFANKKHSKKTEMKKMLNQLYLHLKIWMEFIRDSLLYLVASVMESDCSLEKDVDLVHQFGNIFMKNTLLSASYVQLVDTISNYLNSFQQMYDTEKNKPEHKKRNSFSEGYDFFSHTEPDRLDDFKIKVASPISKKIKKQLETKQRRRSVRVAHGPSYHQVRKSFEAFCKQVSDQLQSENKELTISPTIKAVNEKIMNTFTVVLQWISTLIESFIELENVIQLENQQFVRGISCEIVPSKAQLDDNKKIYYKDGGLEILESRAKKYMNLLQDQYLQDAEAFENISQQEAVRNKKELIQLKEQLQNFTSKEDSLRAEVEKAEKQVAELKEILSNYEKKCMSIFVNLQMMLQKETKLDVDNLINMSMPKESSTDSGDVNKVFDEFEKFDRFVHNTVKVLNSELTRVTEERDELKEKLHKNYDSSSVGFESKTIKQGETGPSGKSSTKIKEKIESTSVSDSNQKSKEVQKKEIVISESDSCKIVANLQSELDDLFTSKVVDREYKLKEYYENKIAYLMTQIDSCDMKSVEYRIQWQRAVEELEKAYAREKELTLQVQQVKELLSNTQDELKTTRKNYEEQIKLLSLSLTSKENKKDERGFIESLFTREKS